MRAIYASAAREAELGANIIDRHRRQPRRHDGGRAGRTPDAGVT